MEFILDAFILESWIPNIHSLLPLNLPIITRAVLVPEVVVRLIQQDMHLTEDNAREVLKESKEFGRLMHPGDNSKEFEKVQRRMADKLGRAQRQLTAWTESGSELEFNEFVRSLGERAQLM